MENQQHHYEQDQYRKDQETNNPEPVKKDNRDSQALAALVLGILAVFGLLNGFGINTFISLVMGITGLFLAASSLKRGPDSMAQAGKVLSIIATVLSATILITCLIAFASGSSFGSFRYINQTTVMPRVMMHRFWF